MRSYGGGGKTQVNMEPIYVPWEEATDIRNPNFAGEKR